jgi:RNA polymerase sigma factor (sigma-70 family)
MRGGLVGGWEIVLKYPVSSIPSFRSFRLPEQSQFRDLIRRVRDRDQEAATELVRRYESAIRRVVRIHLRDARMRRVLDSMDICQSVLASFFVRTALGQYEVDSPEKLLSLLTSITRNKLANQAHRMQAQRRDIRRDAPIGDQADRIPDQASDPSEQASAKEILEKVRGRLDDDERYLAEQRGLGRDWQELADELGGNAGALRKKLSRALDRVMAELGLDEADDG